MKHYSAASLARLARLPLHEECDVIAHIRSLVITDGKAAVARQLGVGLCRLTMIVRGKAGVPDAVAEKLGYRRVTRYERIS